MRTTVDSGDRLHRQLSRRISSAIRVRQYAETRRLDATNNGVGCGHQRRDVDTATRASEHVRSKRHGRRLDAVSELATGSHFCKLVRLPHQNTCRGQSLATTLILACGAWNSTKPSSAACDARAHDESARRLVAQLFGARVVIGDKQTTPVEQLTPSSAAALDKRLDLVEKEKAKVGEDLVVTLSKTKLHHDPDLLLPVVICCGWWGSLVVSVIDSPC
jgi:hypothetical protein